MAKNWNEIVNDLLLVYNQVELERKTGVSQPIISKLKNGSAKPNLTWTNGNALDAAHKSAHKLIKQAKQEGSE